MSKKPAKKDPNVYSKGWNRKRVEATIAHYDNQPEEEAIAEADAAWANASFSLVRVPNSLLEEVNDLIAQHAAHKRRTRTTTKKKNA